jgi:hypothetical protein
MKRNKKDNSVGSPSSYLPIHSEALRILRKPVLANQIRLPFRTQSV